MSNSFHQDTPFRFLYLPFDIREHIYIAFLSLGDSSRVPEDPTPERRRPVMRNNGTSTPVVYALLTSPTPSTTHLLLANRQLYSEFSSTIETRRSTLTYTLDILATGHSIYPTWISFPAPRRYISRVFVNYRADRWGEPVPRRQPMHSAGLNLIAGLLQILSGFLNYGPTFHPANLEHPLPVQPSIVLHELVVGYVREGPDRSRGPLGSVTWVEPKGSPEDDDGKTLVEQIDDHINMGLLHGRVKKVKVMCEEWAKYWEVPDDWDAELVRDMEKDFSHLGWRPIH